MYSKSEQLKKRYFKVCTECKEPLLFENFATPGTRICKPCKSFLRLKKQGEMQQRSIERLKTKKQKKKVVMSIANLKKKVQRVFNKWIRKRDADLLCISCHKYADKYDAGHYVAQGSSGVLRYNEDNVNKQCSNNCNRFKHGNLIEYRINLIKKIGIRRLEYLEEHRNDIKKWTREELNELLVKYS